MNKKKSEFEKWFNIWFDLQYFEQPNDDIRNLVERGCKVAYTQGRKASLEWVLQKIRQTDYIGYQEIAQWILKELEKQSNV